MILSNRFFLVVSFMTVDRGWLVGGPVSNVIVIIER